MKTNLKYLSMLAVVSALLFVTCKKDKEEFSAEDARVEMKAAGQKMQTHMIDMMSTPAVESMFFLMNFIDLDDNLKSAITEADKMNLRFFNSFSRDHFRLKDDGFDPMEGGEYTFNFDLDDFELTNPDVSYLMLIFPADEIAYANSINNAEIKLENMTFVEIEVSDDWDTDFELVLTKLDASFKIDNQTVMVCNYVAQLNNEGLPVSASFNMSMQPYQITLTQSGAGVNYTSTASFKEGNNVILSYNASIRYTPQQDEIEKLSGYFQMNPLRFEGDVHFYAMYNCPEADLNCINDKIDVVVSHTDKNKIIGNIEYRMYYDELDEDYPEPVIVYSDGSYEWLFVALGLELGDFKRGFKK